MARTNAGSVLILKAKMQQRIRSLLS